MCASVYVHLHAKEAEARCNVGRRIVKYWNLVLSWSVQGLQALFAGVCPWNSASENQFKYL